MLAQNFKTPADLSLSDVDFEALIKVLGALERGDVEYKMPLSRPDAPNGFNMGPYINEQECGTTACIAGWAFILSGRTAFTWVGNRACPNNNRQFFELLHFTAGDRREIRPPQAAIALRNYLTHGDARWSEALAG